MAVSEPSVRPFKLGVLINPYAGLGGPLGLKGSDQLAGHQDIDSENNRALTRCKRCLQALAPVADRLQVYGYSGAMGGDCALAAGLVFHALGQSSQQQRSTAEDTVTAARALRDSGVDVLLFAGGDGTARDIYRAIGDDFPVLGLPAGVKMHSGVYALSPEAAAEVVLALIRGDLVELAPREVRDIDEQAFAQGRVRARHYGELLVPAMGGFLQQTKVAGREVEALAVADIAAEVVEEMAEQPDNCLYLVGPGSTTAAVMEALALDNTLLGFDAVQDGELLGADVNAEQIASLLSLQQGPVKVLITAIGGQGHILGRGNQQLTPAIIRQIGREHFWILASKSKISALNGRPLWVDSDDAQLDEQWRGYIRVITGYRDAILYPVGAKKSVAV